jgi:hypothetical protein
MWINADYAIETMNHKSRIPDVYISSLFIKLNQVAQIAQFVSESKTGKTIAEEALADELKKTKSRYHMNPCYSIVYVCMRWVLTPVN